MNGKKAGWLFLCMMLVRIAAPEILYVICPSIFSNMVSNTIISELIILVPACIFLFANRQKEETVWQFLGFRKMRISTVPKVILYTWLSMPLVTLANLISMLFADNAVLGYSDRILKVPFLLMFVLMAVYGPFCEEVVCRGVFYQGYRKSGTALQALLLSAVLFGLMHMNLNQALYAFVVGVLAVLLLEATGSILSTILYHFLFNAQSVCYMFLLQRFMPKAMEEAVEQAGDMSMEMMLVSMSIYLVLAVGGTALACCVLAWIAKTENRTEQVLDIWRKRKERKGRVITIPLILGIVISVGYMLLTAYQA